MSALRCKNKTPRHLFQTFPAALAIPKLPQSSWPHGRNPPPAPISAAEAPGGRTCRHEEASMDIKVGRKAIAEATEKLRNWGRWGKDDQIGTLNHVTPGGYRQGGEPHPHRQGFCARHPARRQWPADRAIRRPLQSHSPDAGDRHRRDCRATGLEQNPLRRRHAHSVRPGRHPLGRARPRLLRGQGL